MWGKIFLVTTGLLSLFYFLFPEQFDVLDTKSGDVLGIKKINAQVNKQTIETAILAYCLNENELPDSLNKLYEGYLDERIKIDLSSLFDYKQISDKDCKYHLDAN